jgi:hypothetical protein
MRVSVCEQRWSPPCAAELCCPHARMPLLQQQQQMTTRLHHLLLLRHCQEPVQQEQVSKGFCGSSLHHSQYVFPH